jgi:hypothetical protein
LGQGKTILQFGAGRSMIKNVILFYIIFNIHGGFLEGVYEIELDTKTEYEGF